MAVTEAERKAIVKEHNKFLRNKGKEAAAERERILSEYTRLVGDGHTPLDASAQVCERFGCTQRKIDNFLTKSSGASAPAMVAFNQATIMGAIGKLDEQITRAAEHTDEVLEQYDELEDDAWVSIEQTEAPNGITTKRVPVAQAKRQALNDLVQQVQEKVKALKALVPQTVIQQNFDNRTVVDQMSDADLDRQLSNHGVQGGGRKSA